MQIDKNTCLEILSTNGLVPSKDKGQNYLINPLTAEKIVDLLNINDKDKVLEIGPGIGSLTHYLNAKTDNLDVIDIDEKSCEILKKLYQNLNIINQDALKLDISKYTLLISNVPYSITSDLLEYVLLKGTNLKQLVLMVQEDAYRRIVSLSGKDYGPLSILIHLLGSVKTAFKVSMNDFIPRPKCTSIVFTINLFDKKVIDERGYKVIKTLFTNRRKTLLNNMLLLMDKDKATGILNQLGLPLTVRGEEINPETYLEIVSLCNK